METQLKTRTLKKYVKKSTLKRSTLKTNKVPESHSGFIIYWKRRNPNGARGEVKTRSFSISKSEDFFSLENPTSIGC